jgi:hypothetical protein
MKSSPPVGGGLAVVVLVGGGERRGPYWLVVHVVKSLGFIGGYFAGDNSTGGKRCTGVPCWGCAKTFDYFPRLYCMQEGAVDLPETKSSSA